MAAFGAGTLPTMLAAGVSGNALQQRVRSRRVRIIGGLIVAGFGIAGLLRAAHGLPDWAGLFCLTPSGWAH